MDTDRGEARRPRRQAFDFDGDYGEGYEALARLVIPGYLSSFSQALALLQGRIAADAKVLIVGAGTGIEIVTFKTAEPAWRITGVDPSRQMIGLARRRIAESGLDDSVDLVHGYVADLEVGDFDAATCFNVMHFLADDGAKGALLASISDRLAPGASLILFDLYGDRGTEAFDEQYAAWRRYWAGQGMASADRAAFQTRLDAGIHWVPEARIIELLGEGGFGRIRQFFRGLLYGAWIAEKNRN